LTPYIKQLLAGLALLAVVACAGLPAYTPVDEAKVLQVQRRSGEATEADVSALLGHPWRKVDFDNINQVAWDYVMRDSWGYWVDVAVMIDRRGRVAGVVLARRDPPER
jgi:outer membrane protein assembly factor BamE (lipoprotein component of BamABCDE complex)